MVVSPRFKSLTYLIVENDYEEHVYFYLVVMYIYNICRISVTGVFFIMCTGQI